ncbi:MAG: hypothetical protein PF692_09710 [Kiritimatiellae bacterium]|jgi:hypothetical protein|nr:hypothetical protein [Kiritimatiellia bacterium]
MSLIQEALKRQEEEQKKNSGDSDRSIADAISDDVKLSLKPKKLSLEKTETEPPPSVEETNNTIIDDDDFILPDDFDMNDLVLPPTEMQSDEKIPVNVPKVDSPPVEVPPMEIPEEDTPTVEVLSTRQKPLLAKKEELAFSPKEQKNEPIAPPEKASVGLKFQPKEAPKKLYEDPAEEVLSKKSKKNKKKPSSKKDVKADTGVPVHPALNKSGDNDNETNSDKTSVGKLILAIILFLLLIGAGIYYGVKLIGGGDFTFITKYIPNSVKDYSDKTSSDSGQGSIKVNTIVKREPKSTAGKAVAKAELAAGNLKNAQKQVEVVDSTSGTQPTETKVEAVNNKPDATTTSSKTDVATSEGTSLADKYHNSQMTAKIKAKLEAKRLAEEEQKLEEQSEDTTDKMVRWPRAKLSGTIGLGKSGAAIFDGNEIVDVGQTYKGMTLKDVTKEKTSGVVLEYEGETRFLATGLSL